MAKRKKYLVTSSKGVFLKGESLFAYWEFNDKEDEILAYSKKEAEDIFIQKILNKTEKIIIENTKNINVVSIKGLQHIPILNFAKATKDKFLDREKLEISLKAIKNMRESAIQDFLKLLKELLLKNGYSNLEFKDGVYEEIYFMKKVIFKNKNIKEVEIDNSYLYIGLRFAGQKFITKRTKEAVNEIFGTRMDDYKFNKDRLKKLKFQIKEYEKEKRALEKKYQFMLQEIENMNNEEKLLFELTEE